MLISNEQKLKYLNRRLLEIKDLKTSVDLDNIDLTLMIAHRIKGNGETFGFPLISSIGASLEKAAHDKDKIKMLDFINELSLIINENLKLCN
jgi:HPt (histidine-containing phosphotransfer) domain-containing protein